jgi:hypothetical protein
VPLVTEPESKMEASGIPVYETYDILEEHCQLVE